MRSLRQFGEAGGQATEITRDAILTAVNALLILNDPPYGTERSYNGLRLALALAKVEGTSVRVFLMGDAIGCAKRDQKTPDGYYNLERMLKGLTAKAVTIGACGISSKVTLCTSHMPLPVSTGFTSDVNRPT